MADLLSQGYLRVMKTIVIAGILGTVIFMTGCIEPGYHQRYSRAGYGYYNDGRYANSEGYYGAGYDRPYYRSQNVNRVIVY